jgi:predicted small secreted protein
VNTHHLWIALGCATFALAGCNAILGIGEPIAEGEGGAGGEGPASSSSDTTSSSSGGGEGGATSTTSAGGSGGQGGGGGSPPCGGARPETLTLLPNADTAIFQGGTEGANSFGHLDHATVGSGVGLVRFSSTGAFTDALAQDRVLGMRLRLERNEVCNGCAGLDQDITIAVHPMRNDWVEGDASPYSGAEWFRRTAGQVSAMTGEPWHMPGASGADDRGAAAAQATIPGTSDLAEIPLPVDAWDLWTDDSFLSVLVRKTSADGYFVFATKEAAGLNGPRLLVEVCPE